MNTLLAFKDKKVIKIVTGMRRCGKSTLLEMYSQKLIESGIPAENIIKMNFESMKYDNIRDYRDLYDQISVSIAPTGKTYIILDEIQAVSQWEKAIGSFLVDFDVDIYITGSNAFLLSSEISTLLSGRYVEIKMLPLSFKEFLLFNQFNTGISNDEKFETYLKFGGMPAVSAYDFNQNMINIMLEGVYSTVILKDVIARNTITDQSLLRKIVLFLADNIGNATSPNNIGNALLNEGHPASRTISAYIDALQSAYIFYGIKRYDIKGKQYLKTQGKYYIVDTGIRNMLLGYRDIDRGHILENIVYFELLRRGYSVDIGKAGEKEIDFIAHNADEKVYFQITESLLDETVHNREMSSFRNIDDNYEKVVLSMDKNFIASENGIKIKNLIDFLLEN